MKRRAFLGAIGGAAVAGPSVAKEAISKASLQIPPTGSWGRLLQPTVAMGEEYDPKSWAKDSLKKLVGMSSMQKDRARREHHINELEPDVACLRSVNMQTRIRMSKRMAFDRSQHFERETLQGIINGWWER